MRFELFHPVIITARSDTAHILNSSTRNPGIRHILSITDPSDKPPFGFWASNAHKKQLIFEDVRDPNLTMAPSKGDVAQIIQFCENWPVGDMGVIHCFAGQSRSTAAAAILYQIWYKDPVKANDALRETVGWSLRNGYRKSKGYFPNTLLISIADEIMGMNGQFAAAITGGVFG